MEKLNIWWKRGPAKLLTVNILATSYMSVYPRFNEEECGTRKCLSNTN